MLVQEILRAQKNLDGIDSLLSFLLVHFDTPLELIGKSASSLSERDPIGYKQYLDRNPERKVALEKDRKNILESILKLLELLTGSLKTINVSESLQKDVHETYTLFSKRIDSINHSKEMELIVDQGNYIKILKTISQKNKFWNNQFFKEFMHSSTINYDKKGLINYVKIREKGIECLFKEDAWSKFPEIIKQELEEVLKCFFSDAWTSGAMMLLRSGERALRDFYKNITGKAPKNKNWGILVEEIRKSQKASSTNQSFIGYLDYLKDIRNSLQHPDRKLEQLEAEKIMIQTSELLEQVYT